VGKAYELATIPQYCTRRLREKSVLEAFKSSVLGHCESLPDEAQACDLLAAVDCALLSEVGRRHKRTDECDHSWWNVACADAYEKLTAARNSLARSSRVSRTRRAVLRKRFRLARAAFRRAVYSAKRLQKRQKLELLCETDDTSSRQLYQRVRALRNPSKPSTVPVKPLAECWNEIWSYRALPDEHDHNEEIAQLMSSVSEPSERDAHLCDLFTLTEVKNALAKCKRGKSPDLLGHDYDMLRALPDEALEIYVKICNRLWTDDPVPPQWLEGWIRFIPKSGGRPDEPRDFRPISLLSVWFKLLERMLWSRLQAWQPDWTDAQAGFRAGRNCTAQTTALHMMREWLQATNQTAYAVFLDISKAFDSVSHTAVRLKMLRMGLPPKVVSLIGRLLHARNNHVMGGVTDEVITVGRGAPQGSVLGPFLFLVMINDLPEFLEQQVPAWRNEQLPVRRMLWADDTLLVSQSPSRVQELLDACLGWSKMWGLEFNAAKSEVLPLGAHPLSNTCKVAATFTLNGDAIPSKKTAKHLGVVHVAYAYERKRYDLLWTEEKTATVHGWAQTLMPLLKERAILSPKKIVRVLRTVILPSILYGSEAALPPARAQVAVNSVLRVMLNAYQRTPRRVLHYLSGLWRVDALAQQRRLNALVRWTLPTYAAPEPAAAIALAKQHRLPWWQETEKDLIELGLETQYAVHASSVDEVKLQLAQGTCSEAQMEETCRMISRSWNRVVRSRLDRREAQWQREQWPQLTAREDELQCAMHPLCKEVQAAGSVHLFMPSMVPPDVFQKQDDVNGPCLLCSLPGGDTMAHMVSACEAPFAVDARKASGANPAQFSLPLLLSMNRSAAGESYSRMNALCSKLVARRNTLLHA